MDMSVSFQEFKTVACPHFEWLKNSMSLPINYTRERAEAIVRCGQKCSVVRKACTDFIHDNE